MVYLMNAKDRRLPYYLPKTEERRDWFMCFSRELARETQTTISTILIQVCDSISNGDKR